MQVDKEHPSSCFSAREGSSAQYTGEELWRQTNTGSKSSFATRLSHSLQQITSALSPFFTCETSTLAASLHAGLTPITLNAMMYTKHRRVPGVYNRKHSLMTTIVLGHFMFPGLPQDLIQEDGSRVL